jgi:hypothetical protein
MGKRRTIFWTEWFQRGLRCLSSFPEMEEMLLIAFRQLELEADASPCVSWTKLRLQTLPSLDEGAADLLIYYRISPDDEEVWLMWIEPKGLGAQHDQRLREELEGLSLGLPDSPFDGRSH